MSHLSSTKGREEDPGDYRPLNPTSVSGKFMGKVLVEAPARRDLPRTNHN